MICTKKNCIATQCLVLKTSFSTKEHLSQLQLQLKSNLRIVFMKNKNIICLAAGSTCTARPRPRDDLRRNK